MPNGILVFAFHVYHGAAICAMQEVSMGQIMGCLTAAVIVTTGLLILFKRTNMDGDA